MPSRDDLPCHCHCRCCDRPTISDADCFESCDICGWDDDPTQLANPGFPGGANRNSLRQARDASLIRALFAT
ncbi:MAG: CPCC family cysteine-rich protein [Janthinobacterium lividum]